MLVNKSTALKFRIKAYIQGPLEKLTQTSSHSQVKISDLESFVGGRFGEIKGKEQGSPGHQKVNSKSSVQAGLLPALRAIFANRGHHSVPAGRP